MGMQFHCLPHQIGDLMKTAIFHIKECLQNSPLHRLQTVFKRRDSSFANDIRGIFKKIFIEQSMEFSEMCVHILFGEGIYALWSGIVKKETEVLGLTLNYQVFHNILPTRRRVFAHIERKDFGNLT